MEIRKNQSDPLSQEISIRDLLHAIISYYRFLLSKWLLILFFGILGAAVGLTYALLKKPVYTAATSFVLEEGGSTANPLASLGGLASMVGIDMGSGGGIFQGDNILEVYKSRTMIQKTLLTEVEFNNKKQLLIDRYIEFNNLRESWAKNPKLSNISFRNYDGLNRLQDSIIGLIVDDIRKEYLVVGKPDKKLSIISAEVKSRDEFFSLAFDNEIVKNVNAFYIQTKTKKSLENVNILQQKVDSVRAVMDGAIYSAAVVLDATPNLNPTRQLQRSAPVQKSQFSAETNKAILGELVKNLELSKMSLRKETPLIQVLDEPVFPLHKDRVGKSKGVIFGGMLGGIIICLALIAKRFFRKLLS